MTPLVQEVAYTAEDFEAIVSTEEVKFILFSNPEFTDIRSLEDLKAYGQDHQIKFGAGNPSSAMYFAQKTLCDQLGIDSALVNHDSAAQGMVNLLGGHIDVTLAGVDQAKEYVENGDFVPLAVFDSASYDGYADIVVPSTQELGYDVEFKLLIYFGIRSGTNPIIVEKLTEAFNTVLVDEAYIAEMGENHDPSYEPMGPEGIKEYVAGMTASAKKLFGISD